VASQKTNLDEQNSSSDRGVMASESGDSPSSRGLDYWLRHCEGFRADGPDGRLGHVRGVRFGSSGEPEVLEVQAGLLGRRTLLISVSQVEEIIPEQRRLVLRGSPRLLGSEQLEE
jgi:hypothetical protein